jgi:hypothetical protein
MLDPALAGTSRVEPPEALDQPFHRLGRLSLGIIHGVRLAGLSCSFKTNASVARQTGEPKSQGGTEVIVMTAILGAAAAAAQTPALPAFIAGCWNLSDGAEWTQECWMEPKAGMMLGASRQGTGETLNSWEQLRIERSADGKIMLFAAPGGQNAIRFEATKVGADAIEFTNSAHDYPQRIRYELKGGQLDAEISLIDGSKPVRWTYSRDGD